MKVETSRSMTYLLQKKMKSLQVWRWRAGILLARLDERP